jgi:hypothetical protein
MKTDEKKDRKVDRKTRESHKNRRKTDKKVNSDDIKHFGKQKQENIEIEGQKERTNIPIRKKLTDCLNDKHENIK